MFDQISTLLGFHPSELAGAHASGEIPLPAPFVNRLIAAQLAESGTPVSAVTVEPRDGNVVLAHVRLRASFVPPLTVHMRIEQQPRLPESPTLVIRWSLTGLGILGRLAGPLLAIVDRLPPGMSVNGDLMTIDVAQILKARGYGDAMAMLIHLEVCAEQGRFVVRAAGRMPEFAPDAARHD